MSGSLICFLPYASRTQSASAFSDLAGRESQAAAIEKMAAEGIIAPKSPGKFDPGGVFTRGEFAVAAQHLFKLPKPAKEIYFADVPKGSPLYDAVQAVAPFMDRGALCPECLLSSNFVADAPISHAYAVVSLARLNIAKNKVALVDPREVASALEGVPDVAGLSAEARQLIATAIKSGVLRVSRGHPFAPAASYDRGDMAEVLHEQTLINAQP